MPTLQTSHASLSLCAFMSLVELPLAVAIYPTRSLAVSSVVGNLTGVAGVLADCLERCGKVTVSRHL
ncbi:hypothetical protein CDL15_Pgr023711 [Punica granatum]|uniref:Uncharacterized protein n=1 Tax=Punica granatum TaxID=22663 RepID=A0A218XLX6_PUNGR|nr:hypothetical protein CDL15_Pgr023711 [Punica granatum]PKI65193.1 hypothetical protein CRG98_014342 [Punica granatum]